MIFSIFCLLSLASTGAYAQFGSLNLPNLQSMLPMPALPPNSNPLASLVSTFMPWLQNGPFQLPRSGAAASAGAGAGIPFVNQFVPPILAPFTNPNILQNIPFVNMIRPEQFIPGFNNPNRPEATQPADSLPSALPQNLPNLSQLPNTGNLQQVAPGAANLPGSNLIAGTKNE